MNTAIVNTIKVSLEHLLKRAKMNIDIAQIDVSCNLQGKSLFVALSVSHTDSVKLDPIRLELQESLRGLPDVDKVLVTFTAHQNAPTHHKSTANLPKQQNINGVHNTIAIASAKGGVGKSTVAANTAVALAKLGLNVGLLDVDIYGPSQPLLMGVPYEKPSLAQDGKTLIPIMAHGIKVMSIGFLLEENSALIWRGPMVISAITQMLFEVEWAPLDVLILDLPPGTGDAQLSIVQKIPLTGVVIVTTPQELAISDVRRGITMFNKVNVPIIGYVENMYAYCCPNCGHEDAIFKSDSHNLNFSIPHITSIPLSRDIVTASDAGIPIVVSNPNHTISQKYSELSNSIVSFTNNA